MLEREKLTSTSCPLTSIHMPLPFLSKQPQNNKQIQFLKEVFLGIGEVAQWVSQSAHCTTIKDQSSNL